MWPLSVRHLPPVSPGYLNLLRTRRLGVYIYCAHATVNHHHATTATYNVCDMAAVAVVSASPGNCDAQRKLCEDGSAYLPHLVRMATTNHHSQHYAHRRTTGSLTRPSPSFARMSPSTATTTAMFAGIPPAIATTAKHATVHQVWAVTPALPALLRRRLRTTSRAGW